MGCSCRGGIRPSASRSVVAPRVASPATRSLCSNLEAEGNNLTVRVGADGRLFLGDMPAASILSSTGCRGSFAQAVLAANMKLSSIFMSPAVRMRFQAATPVSNLKLGYLREILRGF